MNAESADLRPTRRQRRTAETQARLLDAATAVFVARGYDATTLGEVTERADLGTGTLYLHFRDKRALYEAVARRALAGLYERWLRSVKPTDTAETRMLAMVRVALEFFAAHRELARLFLLDGPAVESWLVDDVVRAIAGFLEGPQRELRATLIVGATLAAARHHVRTRHPPPARTLIDATLACCAGAVAGPERAASPARRGARRDR